MSVTGGDTSFAIDGGQLVFEGAPFYECTKAG